MKSSAINFRHKKIRLFLGAVIVLVFVAVIAISLTDRRNECEVMVDSLISNPIEGMKKANLDKIKNDCYEKILDRGSYRDLYAYYRMYKFVDVLNNDKGEDNIYHWMLFYANENSRIFNESTGAFEKSYGLYYRELKDFENNMTQEEKKKSFAYLADNIATGKEGWVKKHDYQKSFEYLKKAAEEGDVKLQIYLGYSFFTGRDWMNKLDVEKDYRKCYKWLYISTLHSSQQEYLRLETLTSLKNLQTKMSYKDILYSKELAKTWFKENDKFVMNNPLKIIKMTKKKINTEKKRTKDFIKQYNLNNTN